MNISLKDSFISIDLWPFWFRFIPVQFWCNRSKYRQYDIWPLTLTFGHWPLELLPLISCDLISLLCNFDSIRAILKNLTFDLELWPLTAWGSSDIYGLGQWYFWPSTVAIHTSMWEFRHFLWFLVSYQKRPLNDLWPQSGLYLWSTY